MGTNLTNVVRPLPRESPLLFVPKNRMASFQPLMPIAIKASGISLVIANTFARIFYRNAINIGLAILECPEAVANINDGDKVEADLDNGIIYNLTTGKEFKTQPFPEFIQKIITNGGLIESIKKGELN